MMKYQVEITTHSACSFAVNNKSVPYFREKGIYLPDLQPKHLRDFYLYVLKKFELTTNTVLHYHANIRQALQHAFEMDTIPSNPTDKVKRLKKSQFIGSYYTCDELNDLFEVVKGDPVELAVILAAFYGLRRSEIVGLKWDAINFQHQTITIRHSHYSTTANIYVHLEYSSKLSSAQVMSNTLQIPSMQKAPESPQKETQELVHYKIDAVERTRTSTGG
ncbi:tyrosine-type recombinase/integrase [Paenibacillus sp. TH7-28]